MIIFVVDQRQEITVPVEVTCPDMTLGNIHTEYFNNYKYVKFNWQGQMITDMNEKLSDLGITSESKLYIENDFAVGLYQSNQGSTGVILVDLRKNIVYHIWPTRRSHSLYIYKYELIRVDDLHFKSGQILNKTNTSQITSRAVSISYHHYEYIINPRNDTMIRRDCYDDQYDSSDDEGHEFQLKNEVTLEVEVELNDVTMLEEIQKEYPWIKINIVVDD